MKMQGAAILLLRLGWCFPVMFSQDLMTVEDLNGSGDDLEYSSSGKWTPRELEAVIAMSPPNSTDPENLQYQTISANPEKTGHIAIPPKVETTFSHVKATSRALPASDMEQEAVDKQITYLHLHEEDKTSLPAATLQSTPTSEADSPDTSAEDMESGDGAVEMSTDLPLTTDRRAGSMFNIIKERKIVPPGWAYEAGAEISDDSDMTFDPSASQEAEMADSAMGNLAKSEGLLEKKEVLAAVVSGGVVGLVLAMALVFFMVFRMKKKDEGSYTLDMQQSSYKGYMKPQRQEEFLA